MKFQKFMISLLLIGLQSRYSGCDEPPRVREYDSDVPNIYNGGLKVEQLSEGNEKMAKFADSSRVELSLDQYTDDSYIQAYKLTHENYQNNKEKLSIDVARENRAHLAGFRVKRQAVNKLESEKFQMSEAKIPDEATLEVMRTKKELRNVRSPYEVVENPTKATKSNRMGYRAKVTPRLYSGMPTHRYGLNSDYNRAAQAVNFRKADQPKFGDKLLWNPSELNRYKRLQHRAHQLPVPAPTPVILNNGVAQQTQQIHLPQVNQQAYLDQQQQQQYVATYIPYQDLATIPQAQPTYNQQQYNQVDSQNYNYLYNQFPQYENQQLQQQQFFQANPYGPVELHYDQANTQYASPQKLDGLQVLQSLLGQNPKQQLEGLRELLSKEELYQQQLVQQQQYEQQQLRPQDSTAPIVFHPIAGGQVNQIPVTKSPQYQFTVAGSTKQIVPIPTSTTTFAPHVPTPTTVSPTTIRYQDLLPSSTPAPFSVVTDENPLKLLPAPVQNGPESQNALFHGHQYQITSTPLPLISQHNAISSNSLQNHNQQKAQQHHRQQHDGDNRSEHDANHDVSIKAKLFYSPVVHNVVKRSAPKRRPIRPTRQRGSPTQVGNYFSQNPQYDFYAIPRTKKTPKRVVPKATKVRKTIFDDQNYRSRPNFEYDSKNDESSPMMVEYETIFDENEFYRNRKKVLKLTEMLRKKNNEFFENLDKSDTIADTNKKISPDSEHQLNYEYIFNNLPSPYTNLGVVPRLKRDINHGSVVNFSDLKNERYGDLRIDWGVNLTLSDPERDELKESDVVDELEDLNSYYFDENGTLIEDFDELNMAANESRILYHLMPISNSVDPMEPKQVSHENRSISDRASYEYEWNGDEDESEDGQYIDDEDEDDEEDYEEKPRKKIKIIKVIEPKWRPRKTIRKRVNHGRQKYKIVPVTVYKKIPIHSATQKYKSDGDVNIRNVNIYENKSPPTRIVHHRPEWHFTQTIKKFRKPKYWHRPRIPPRPRNRTKFNKFGWLLRQHHYR